MHSLIAAVVSTPPCSPNQIPLVILSGGPLGSTEALSDVASVLCHSCVGFVKHHFFVEAYRKPVVCLSHWQIIIGTHYWRRRVFWFADGCWL